MLSFYIPAGQRPGEYTVSLSPPPFAHPTCSNYKTTTNPPTSQQRSTAESGHSGAFAAEAVSLEGLV